MAALNVLRECESGRDAPSPAVKIGAVREPGANSVVIPVHKGAPLGRNVELANSAVYESRAGDIVR